MIRVEDLTCYYGERLAVDNIAFNVEKGEIVGFLGPNGAGKSSTMRTVTGYLMPTRGKAWVADHDMTRDSREGRRHLGYLPEVVPLYYDMTTRAYLQYAGRLRGIDKATTTRRVDTKSSTSAPCRSTATCCWRSYPRASASTPGWHSRSSTTLKS